MAQKKSTQAKLLGARVVDFSGGENNAIHPALLGENESALVSGYSLDEKGTLTPIKGRRARYSTPFSTSPVNGIGRFTRSDGVSRLMIGAGNELYVDTPRLVETFDSQTEWETGTLSEQVDKTTSSGSLTIKSSDGNGIWSATISNLTNLGLGKTYGRYFTLSKRIRVKSFRIAAKVLSGVYSLAIWRIVDGALIATLNRMVSADGVWQSFDLDTPVVLERDVRYCVGAYHPSQTNFLYFLSDAVYSVPFYININYYGSTFSYPVNLWTTVPPTGLSVDLSYDELFISDSLDLTDSSAETNVISSPMEGGLTSDPALTGASSIATYTYGWRFKMLQSRSISKLRARDNYGGDANAGKASIWRVSDQARIAEVNFKTTGLNTYYDVYLDAPVSLVQGEDYIVSVRNTGSNNIWYWSGVPPINTAVIQYTDAGSVYATSDVYPSTAVAPYYHGSIYPIFDSQVKLLDTALAGSIELAIPSAEEYVIESADLSWVATTPGDSAIQVQVSASDDGATWRAWQTVASGDSLPAGVYLKTKITLTPDTAGINTPILSSAILSATVTGFRGFWESPAFDVTSATDQGTGFVSAVTVTPGSSSILLLSRSSPDELTWTAWVNADLQGNLQHAPDDFAQIRFVIQSNDDNLPVLSKATVSFDGQPSVALLADDFTPGGQFYFGSLLGYSIITNGVDQPRKYDGATLSALGGDPPRGYYTVSHKNRLWMLRGSRLYFSELLDIEDWPILNFIDISPNDGDEATMLYPSGDYLIISKKNSMWILIGDSYDTFNVRRLSASRGCVAPRSVVMMDELLVFVSDDGVYFSDFAQTTIASERLRKTWDGLNARRLNQAAAWFAKQKLYVSLPSANSTINDTIIVFDVLRKAWYKIKDWNVSCATSWVEAGQQVWLVGHSDEGMVSQTEIGQRNLSEPIESEWESRYFDARMPEVEKRFRKIELVISPAAQTVDLEVQFNVDGGDFSSTITVEIPGRTDKRNEIVEVDPSKAGVYYGRSIGIRVRQTTLDAGVGIVTVNLNFYPVREKATIRG